MKATERSVSLSDADYAAIVKRYEDAGDVQNADIIRRQWKVARAGNTPRDKLLTIIAAAYQVAGAHNVPAHILDVLANPEVATTAQVDAMLPYVPTSPVQASASQVDTRRDEPLITVGFNDLMTLARRLIAEQMDDCDEEFLAGRAHGIGSLHSEILSLARRGDMAQVQDDPKSAGAPETCRSGEKPQESGSDGAPEPRQGGTPGTALPRQSGEHSLTRQLISVTAIKAAISSAAKRLWDANVDEFAEPAEDGDDAGKRNYDAGKAAGAHALEQELMRWIDSQAAAARPVDPSPMCERKTNEIIQRDGYRHTGYVLQRTTADRVCISDGGVVAWFTRDQWRWLLFNRDHVEFQWPKPIGAKPAPAELRIRADLAEEVLATILWLYRRLPRGYGRPPTVERPILALAKLTGIDVAACLAERGAAPKEENQNEGMEDRK